MAIVESLDKTEDSPGRTSTAKTARGLETPLLPPTTPARLEELKFKKQQEILTSWIDDPRHAADATCRHALELYAQLNDSEFLYVSDQQSNDDEVISSLFFSAMGLRKRNQRTCQQRTNLRCAGWEEIHLAPCPR
jgi:hypothetical protein